MQRFALILAVASAASFADAQTAAPIVNWPPVGSRIRMTSTGLVGDRLMGTLLAADPDSVAVQPEGVDWNISIKTSDLTSVEVFRGTHTSFLKGLGIGLAAGALIAGGVEALTWKPEGDWYFTRSTSAMIMAFVGGLGGAVIGGIAGAWPKEDWQTVQLRSR